MMLQEFKIEPGPWFKKYLNDWMEAYDVDDTQLCTSGIVTGQDTGDYIWVTATAKWDLEWFRDNGFQFPSRWIHYDSMRYAVGEDGGTAFMPGL
jgi:hypothetical protein